MLLRISPLLSSPSSLAAHLLIFYGRNPRRESTHSTHVGRGGAANVFKPTAAEIEAAEKDNKWESAVDEGERGNGNGEKERGLADKGKEFLKGVFSGGKK